MTGGPAPAASRRVLATLLARAPRGWAMVPVLVVAWQAFLTWRWLRLDRAFFFWDPAYHMLRAVDFLRAPLRYLTDPVAVLQPPYGYPPVGHVLLGTLYGLTGYDLDLTIAVYNLGFLFLLATSTYLIGRDLYSPQVGALATSFLVLYPEVFIRLRWPLLDLPLTAMTAATVYALVRTRGFREARWSVAFGLLLGLGQLTKHVHVLAVAAPALFVLWRSPRGREAVRNGILAVLVAAAVALPWWLPQITYYLEVWVPGQVAWARAHQGAPVLSVFSIAYFSLGIWSLTSFAFAALWLASLSRFLRLPGRGPVLSWWIGCYLLLTLTVVKHTRYGAVLLPAVALMTAAGLSSWRFGRPVAAMAIVFGLLQAWAMSFGLAWLPRGAAHHPVTLAEPIQVMTQRSHVEQGFWPDPDGWGLAEAFSRLEGRVGVLDAGPGAEQDEYRVAFLVEAAQLQHLRARARAEKLPDVRRASCEEANEPGRFDRLLVPVSSPGWPFEWAGAARCLRGFQQVMELPVHRGPERDPDDFLALRAVRVLVPAPANPESTLEVERPDEAFAPSGEPALLFSAVQVRYSPRGVVSVRVRVRNATDRARSARAFYAIALPGQDPWTRPRFVTPTSDFPVGAREAVWIELGGSGPLPRGPQHLAFALHAVEAGGQSRPCHWANARVVIPAAPAASPATRAAGYALPEERR